MMNTDNNNEPKQIKKSINGLYLVLFEVSSNPPSHIVSQSVSILLEQSVNSRNTTIPRVFQIFQRQTSVLGVGFLTFQSVFCPHTLGIDELTLPGLNITIQVRNDLVIIVAHTLNDSREIKHGTINNKSIMNKA